MYLVFILSLLVWWIFRWSICGCIDMYIWFGFKNFTQISDMKLVIQSEWIRNEHKKKEDKRYKTHRTHLPNTWANRSLCGFSLLYNYHYDISWYWKQMQSTRSEEKKRRRQSGGEKPRSWIWQNLKMQNQWNKPHFDCCCQANFRITSLSIYHWTECK